MKSAAAFGVLIASALLAAACHSGPRERRRR